MRALDVLWLPAELTALRIAERSTVVVDVIRATTSITTALAHGAAGVVPALAVEAARETAARTPGALLCGERNGVPPPGFDMGNSPASFTPAAVKGRSVVFTTTNGTAAIHAAREAAPLRLACWRNLAAVARALAGGPEAEDEGTLILCAGRRGRVSMDDAWCAGHLVNRVMQREEGRMLGDGARAAAALAAELGDPTPAGLLRTEAGRALRGIGLADDLVACAAVDDLEAVPTWRDGMFVQGGEEDA